MNSTDEILKTLRDPQAVTAYVLGIFKPKVYVAYARDTSFQQGIGMGGETKDKDGKEFIKLSKTTTSAYQGFDFRHKPVVNYTFISTDQYELAKPTDFDATTYRPGADLGTQKKNLKSGAIVINLWSYSVADNSGTNYNPKNDYKMGMNRDDVYRFENTLVATITLNLAAVKNNGSTEELLVIQSTEESYYFYNNLGKRFADIIIKRAVKKAKDISAVTVEVEDDLSALKSVVSDGTGAMKDSSLGLDFTNYLKNDCYIVSETAGVFYTEVSSEKYQTLSYTLASESEKAGKSSTLLFRDYRLFDAPLPRNQKIQVLSTGEWQKVSMDDSYTAAYARYEGKQYNNTRTNLKFHSDCGVTQILGAAEADYMTYWDKKQATNFNDIKSLQAALFNFLPVMAVNVCRTKSIKLTYLPYITACIEYRETVRGATALKLDSASIRSGTYPFSVELDDAYDAALEECAKWVAMELSSRDGSSELLASYKKYISGYNDFISGTAPADIVLTNIYKLGQTATNTYGAVLAGVFEFKARFAKAKIDAALSDIFESQQAFTGSINLSDLNKNPLPGDIVSVSFMDDKVKARVMGSSFTVSPTTFTMNMSVKKINEESKPT